MPAFLQEIYEQVQRLPPSDANLFLFQPLWEAHISKAKQAVPPVQIEAAGEVMYLGELSPGCRACKDGTWDCIFMTMRCNLNCAFCYSPQTIPLAYIGSVFGNTPSHIAANHDKTDITGISFTGGEAFLNESQLLVWVSWFTSHYPDKYYWLYTNGLLANGEILQRLAAFGLDEIRFNMAATGYDHPVVMRNLETAVRFIPNVTVEIPVIPKHASKLLASLAHWAAAGVKFLNLHELIYEPDTNSAAMSGARQQMITEDGHRTAVHPESRALTLAVMKKVYEEKLTLSVNDCSMQSKFRQLRGRRRSLSPLTKAPHEKLVADTWLESFYFFRNEQEAHPCHPDFVSEMRQTYAGCQLVRLVRYAPLSLQERKKWIVFENLT